MVKENRVGVSGMGVVSPIGSDLQTFWHNLREGNTGIVKWDDAPTEKVKLYGKVVGFDPLQYMSPKEMGRYPEFVQYSVGACISACLDAGTVIPIVPKGLYPRYEVVSGIDASRGEVIVSVAIGVTDPIAKAAESYSKGKGIPRNTLMLANIAQAAAIPAKILGFEGGFYVLNGACSGGVKALREAFHKVRFGIRDYALAAGAEDPDDYVFFGAYERLDPDLLTREEDPEKACKPMSNDATGTVIGSGAGALFLEPIETARKRGKEPYVEILGTGESNKPKDNLLPSREGTQQAVSEALEEAGIAPEEIDAVKDHGAGTLGDGFEMLGLRDALGKHAERIPIFSLNSSLGHLQGAKGTVEAVGAILATVNGLIPPTLGFSNPVYPEFNVVYGKALPYPVRTMLITGSGLQGIYLAAIVRTIED